jgi:hypothetical protein
MGRFMQLRFYLFDVDRQVLDQIPEMFESSLPLSTHWNDQACRQRVGVPEFSLPADWLAATPGSGTTFMWWFIQSDLSDSFLCGIYVELSNQN